MPDRPALPTEAEIEITPAMLAAGVAVLLSDPLVGDLSPGVAELVAAEVIECALKEFARKTSSGDPPMIGPERSEC